MTENSIVLFKDGDVSLDVPISPERDTVWLSANQMAMLFDKDDKTIRKHINNVFSDDELDKEVVVANFATTSQHGAIAGKMQTRMTQFYNLDVIISVGYRVKSKRGIAFRRWANSVLKQYLLQGYAVNKQRLNQLNQVVITSYSIHYTKLYDNPAQTDAKTTSLSLWRFRYVISERFTT